MQRQIPHPPYTFPACTGCQREPRHMFDARTSTFFGPMRGGHFMLCSCGEGPKHATADAALRAWCDARGLKPDANRTVRALRPPLRVAERNAVNWENKPC